MNTTHEKTAEDIISSREAAMAYGCSSDLHIEDFIFQFLVNNPVFQKRDHAVKYYFNDGHNSAKVLKTLIEDVGINPEKKFRLLEFASGYGCVSRQLPIVMPKVDLVCSDIHKDAMEFIKTKLGQKVAISNSVPDKFSVKGQFDVVFALSFFSHMPKSTWLKWLKVLYSKVSPGGVLIFTTQGLKTAKHYLGDPKIPKDGFWFSAQSEQKDLDVAEYGQTVVTRKFVRAQMKHLPGGVIEMNSPAYWWDHQDLWVIQKKK